MVGAIGLDLTKYSADVTVTGISGEDERLVYLSFDQDGSDHKACFQLFKSLLALLGPIEGSSGPGKIGEWGGNLCERGDVFPIKFAHAQETSHLLYGRWGFHFGSVVREKTEKLF